MSAPPDEVRLAHVAVIVHDVEAATHAFRDLLGLVPAGREVLAQEGIRMAFARAGDSELELIEPLDSRSALGRFLVARGEGIHHLALLVPDMQAAMARARAAGLRLIDEVSRPGARGARIAFLHPSGTCGVLIELVEKRI